MTINILRQELKRFNKAIERLKEEYNGASVLDDIEYELENVADSAEELLGNVEEFLDDVENFMNEIK